MTMDRSNIDQAIADRIASDPAFRDALLSDPKAALSSLSGMAIPESVRITVHEESPTDIHLVIASASALTDSDLELVAGAGDWSPQHLLCSAPCL